MASSSLPAHASLPSSSARSDKQLVETIVEDVCTRVGPLEIKMGDFEMFAEIGRAMVEVMKALEDDRVNAIGVYGMGGVGKTTMVKHVSAQAQKKGIFDYVVMVVVSQSPDIRKVQQTFADLLGFKFKEKTEDGRALRLNEEIMSRNKTLIILDDIWGSIDLSSIGIPHQEELMRCKSKVLLTTRILNVCHNMRCQERIRLDTLSADDSWTLFVKNAGRSFDSTEFEKVARRVASECCGLPISLIAVAKALGDKDLEEWKKAARRLEKSQTANLDGRGEAFKCIKLSYDYLKNEDYKSYFLLCCLFPEGYDIPLEDLFRYAFGEGLFRDTDTIEEARGTAASVAKHLKNCSLLLDSEKNGCVRIHDVVRDTAIEIAKDGYFVKVGFGLKDWPPHLQECNYSVVSLMQNNIRKLPQHLVCTKLQILLLPHNCLNEIPESFFENLKDLRVLDLSKSSISLLPESFSLLTNLQALCLNYCNSIDTSLFGNLKKLEILSMRHYPGEKLSVEIGQLANLRMLDISGGGGIVTIPSKVISKLHRLEELYMLDCGFEKWGSIVEGEGEETNIGFTELVGLSNLKILQINIDGAKYIPEKVLDLVVTGEKAHIKLRYDNLEDEESKSCFLLCCLFPEDYDIPLEDLFRYATLGKGLFRDAGTGVSVVKYLKSCGLLLDSKKEGCVRMHNDTRYVGILIAKSEIAKPEYGHGFFSTDCIFLIINLCLESLSLAFDQTASFRKPHFALIGMFLAIAALLLSIVEFLIKMNKQRNAILGKRSSWTALFGNVPDSFGIAAGLVQSVCSAVQFWYLRHHEENPMKVSLLPALFLICLITVKLTKRRQVAREHND